MKTCNYLTAFLAISLVVAAITASSGLVSADTCAAQLTYPIMPVMYTSSNVPLVVPISASCTTFYGDQLYATGTAYDTNVGTSFGSVNAVLDSVNGGTVFSGQLGFDLPPTSQGHSVQISVSVYNGQYGTLITTAQETIQVSTGTQPYAPTTVIQVPYQYPYQSSYQSSYPSPFQSMFPFRFFQRNTWQRSNNGILIYIIIAAILAAVVIAIAAIAVYARRQPIWYQMQPPPR